MKYDTVTDMETVLVRVPREFYEKHMRKALDEHISFAQHLSRHFTEMPFRQINKRVVSKFRCSQCGGTFATKAEGRRHRLDIERGRGVIRRI